MTLFWSWGTYAVEEPIHAILDQLSLYAVPILLVC